MEIIQILEKIWDQLPQISFFAIIFLYFKIEKLNHKIDKVEENMTKRIDKVEDNLTKRIDKLEDRIFWMMADKHSFHDEKLKEK